MEKIKSSHFRYRMYLTFIVIIILIIIQSLYWPRVLALVISILILPIIAFRDEYRKNYGWYFDLQGISNYKKKKLHSHTNWSDIEVLDVKSRLAINKNRTLKLISKKNPEDDFYIHINWFTELSVIELTKKYVPHDHELYKRVKQYTEERKIPF